MIICDFMLYFLKPRRGRRGGRDRGRYVKSKGGCEEDKERRVDSKERRNKRYNYPSYSAPIIFFDYMTF